MAFTLSDFEGLINYKESEGWVSRGDSRGVGSNSLSPAADSVWCQAVVRIVMKSGEVRRKE